jgi:hypothetical protein
MDTFKDCPSPKYKPLKDRLLKPAKKIAAEGILA